MTQTTTASGAVSRIKENTPPTVADARGNAESEDPIFGESHANLVPVLTCVALLVVTLFSHGGFALRQWAPVCIFSLVVLVTMRGRRLTAAPRVAVAALWGLASWTLLSASWAQSPGAAVEAGMRTTLYAALFALAAGSLRERRGAQRVAAVALAGLALLVTVTYLRVLLDGDATFLAGRLDAPVGYRNATAALFVLAFWPLICVAAARHMPASVRGPAAALAVIALGLAFLTQSRDPTGYVAPGLRSSRWARSHSRPGRCSGRGRRSSAAGLSPAARSSARRPRSASWRSSLWQPRCCSRSSTTGSACRGAAWPVRA